MVIKYPCMPSSLKITGKTMDLSSLVFVGYAGTLLEIGAMISNRDTLFQLHRGLVEDDRLDVLELHRNC